MRKQWVLAGLVVFLVGGSELRGMAPDQKSRDGRLRVPRRTGRFHARGGPSAECPPLWERHARSAAVGDGGEWARPLARLRLRWSMAGPAPRWRLARRRSQIVAD